MSIVKDEKVALEFANNLANILIKEVGEKSQDFYQENDPAEHIYMLSHMTANFYVKMCLWLQDFGKTYGIDGLNSEAIDKFIEAIKNGMNKFND